MTTYLNLQIDNNNLLKMIGSIDEARELLQGRELAQREAIILGEYLAIDDYGADMEKSDIEFSKNCVLDYHNKTKGLVNEYLKKYPYAIESTFFRELYEIEQISKAIDLLDNNIDFDLTIEIVE